MADIFISLHDTVESQFIAIIEGEPTSDGKQIAISAPEALKGITVRAKRFVPIARPLQEALSKIGIPAKPQILSDEEAMKFRRAIPVPRKKPSVKRASVA